MCGICGFWGYGSLDLANFDIGIRMAEAISTRGPDSAGAVVMDEGRLVLAHRRLSVIDTSDAGFQPMVSASGRYTIVYNGEIYNHLELRNALPNCNTPRNWRGHSDTETILAWFDLLGVEATLTRLVGMFAFAVWDHETGSLILARDRMGEKPMYYGTIGGVFLFGSELKAIQRHPLFEPTIDRDALTAFVQRSYVPGPRSIYREIQKLQPGQFVRVTWPNPDADQPKIDLETYWSLSDVVMAGRTAPYFGTLEEATQDLNALLTDVIESQMIADVPLGSFLSGGIDSSLVTAIMQKICGQAVKTFSIGFDDPAFDESQNARMIADYIGTDHIELILTPEHLIDVLPKLPKIYCEPFADSSQIPTFLVSELAKRHVTVALTGDGADEIFGGYNRYMVTEDIWEHTSRIPLPVRTMISRIVLQFPKTTWDRLFTFIPSRLRPRLPGEKIYKIARLLKQTSQREYYDSLISIVENPQEIVAGGNLGPHAIDDWPSMSQSDDFQQWMMFADTLSYLPDDICVKVDRAAMANSLESRAPFLDQRVVEFAWRLPREFKTGGGQSKRILRDVLAGYVPREFFERPKMGFGVPFGQWLRGPLRDWAEELLQEDRLADEGLFNPVEVRRIWTAHLEGKGSHEYVIWNILTFNTWLDHWRK